MSAVLHARVLATPFFSTLAEKGLLDYPVFGLSLTRNATGTLALGNSLLGTRPTILMSQRLTGAIDVSVVQNLSQVVWNEVVPFSPVGTQTNTSGYFSWAIRMTSFAVKHLILYPRCMVILTSCKVNSTEYTPQPTYPGPTDNSSIALLDV